MVLTMDLEAFVARVELPLGLHFKEWGPGSTVPIASKNGDTYFDSSLLVIERESDKECSAFEISALRTDGKGHVRVAVAELATKIDAAIDELCPRERIKIDPSRPFWAVRKRALRSRFISIEFRVESEDLVHCKECERVGERWSGTPEQAVEHAKEPLKGHGD